MGGHPLGNLIIMAMTELTGNLQEAIDSLRKLFHIKAHIFPASLDNVTLAAQKQMEQSSLEKVTFRSRESKLKECITRQRQLLLQRP